MSQFELLEAGPLQPMAVSGRRHPLPQAPPSAPRTAQDALDALRRAEGVEGAIALVPGLQLPEAWTEIAYFDVCTTRGTAVGRTYVWDADFPGGVPLEDASDNCWVFFCGEDLNSSDYLPPTLSGQIWCHFVVPETGYYVLWPHAETYLDGIDDSYYAAVECLIDDVSFGTFQLKPGRQLHGPLVAHLAAAIPPDVPSLVHRFILKQVAGGIYFLSLTIWNIPVVEA